MVATRQNRYRGVPAAALHSPVDLDAIYPMPRPLATIEEHDRWRHADLPDLTNAQLLREARLAEHRADLDPEPARVAWLRERVAAVRAELAARARRPAEPEPWAITWGDRGPAITTASPTTPPQPMRRTLGRSSCAAGVAVADAAAMPAGTTANGHGAAPDHGAQGVWPYAELLAADPRPPAPLCAPFLHAGSALILAGPPNVGKTWLLLSLVRAIASGTPWLGHFPTVAGPVLLLDAESTAFHARQRFVMLEAAFPLGAHLPIHVAVGEGLRVDTEEGFAGLGALLATYKPAVVVGDSLVRMHGRNENDAGQMADVFASVRRLMLAHGCAVVFAHYARK